jgi:hypothetical protein
MGNMQKQSFREIWEGEPYRRLRAELSGALPIRRNCQACSHIGRRVLSRRTFREQDYDLDLVSAVPLDKR